MKKQFFILAAFILLNASFALAEWSGDTLKPEYKNGIGYVISKPEEFAWLSHNASRGQSFILVNDIVFGKDKNSVNRDHPLDPIAVYDWDLDFNGFSVYGIYSEQQDIFVCRSYSIIKNFSYKNFELNIKDTSKYATISSYDLSSCRLRGNVFAEGNIKVSADSSLSQLVVYGGGMVDSVLENRISIEIDAEDIESLIVYGIPWMGPMGKLDTLLVRGAKNYGNITVKAKSIKNGRIFGMYKHGLNKNFYKLANYGNITVDVKSNFDLINVAGIMETLTIPEGVRADIYNEGNISVKMIESSNEVNICGLIKEGYDKNDTTIFVNAINRGNINYKTHEIDSDHFISGGLCKSSDVLKNLINYGNVNVYLVSFTYPSGREFFVGGAIGSAEYSSIFNVFNFGNVTVKPFDKGSSSEGKVYVGGVTGYAGHGIVNSFNLGQVSAEKVNYLGGIAGRFFDTDAFKLMNFGSVSGENVPYIGGITGAYDGSCYMHNGYCGRESHDIGDFANFGDVVALGKSDSVGGIAGGKEASDYSYNASKIVWEVKEDSIENVYPQSTFFDWNVYGLSTKPDEKLFYGEALTTAYMQSKEFVDDLNHMKSKDSSSNVWKLSPVYPYPIIADLEDVLKEHQGILSLPPVRPQRALASFDLSVDGMNVLVSGAKVGTPYSVFNLLGHAILRGRLESQNQMIPLSAAGTYIVKVGTATRKVTVKR